MDSAPDYATYAQIIATLFVALAVEAGPALRGYRMEGTGERGSSSRLELPRAVTVATEFFLPLSVAVLALDCVAINGPTVLFDEGNPLPPVVGILNSLVITYMALLLVLLILLRGRTAPPKRDD